MKFIKNFLKQGKKENFNSPFLLQSESFYDEAFVNSVWYGGQASLLSQIYSQKMDLLGNNSFWQASNRNKGIRKMHSGLPAMIVDTISSIVMSDFIKVEIGCEISSEIWQNIEKENNFCNIMKSSIQKALYMGDGAFKISFDGSFSKYPIIEFYPASKIRFEYINGRVSEIIFLKKIIDKKDIYTLEEIYSKDSIEYRLLDKNQDEIPLDYMEDTKELQNIYNIGQMLAYPLIFEENSRHEGRGKSIFDGKLDIFDALDEIISQWVDAMRDGRVQKYIPVGFLPRSADNGAIGNMSGFESRFIQTEMDLSEGANNQIKIIQPNIAIDALVVSQSKFVEMALNGILSPSTLGIDIKKTDNAEAQREKEKVTLYTRARIIDGLRSCLVPLIEASIYAYSFIKGIEIENISANLEFGEYSAPSFDNQIEIISKAYNGGIMSIETAIDELYGNSWDIEKKEKEAKILKGIKNEK